jgi:drug/metabolite transporter (DMT)-like permease
LLIVRPGTDIFHYGAILIGAMAALNAVYQLMTRQLTQDNPFTTFFYSGLVGVAVFSVWLGVTGFPAISDPLTFGLLCAAGLLGGLGHLLFVLAFYRAPPASLTPFVYLQMIWAIGFGWLIFRQLPDGLALLGMLIIIGSGLWLILHRHRQPRAAR